MSTRSLQWGDNGRGQPQYPPSRGLHVHHEHSDSDADEHAIWQLGRSQEQLRERCQCQAARFHRLTCGPGGVQSAPVWPPLGLDWLP